MRSPSSRGSSGRFSAVAVSGSSSTIRPVGCRRRMRDKERLLGFGFRPQYRRVLRAGDVARSRRRGALQVLLVLEDRDCAGALPAACVVDSRVNSVPKM